MLNAGATSKRRQSLFIKADLTDFLKIQEMTALSPDMQDAEKEEIPTVQKLLTDRKKVTVEAQFWAKNQKMNPVPKSAF